MPEEAKLARFNRIQVCEREKEREERVLELNSLNIKQSYRDNARTRLILNSIFVLSLSAVEKAVQKSLRGRNRERDHCVIPLLFFKF